MRIPCRPNLTRFKRWGVVPASEHQEILVALASLICAQRYDIALTILATKSEVVIDTTQRCSKQASEQILSNL